MDWWKPWRRRKAFRTLWPCNGTRRKSLTSPSRRKCSNNFSTGAGRRRSSGTTMPQQLPDYLQPGLKVVFVGFNPGERSARKGHYYAGFGNQFWNFLFESGLLPVRLGWEDDCRVLEFGIGMTDLVKRWSRSSSELRAHEYRDGIDRLNDRLRRA